MKKNIIIISKYAIVIFCLSITIKLINISGFWFANIVYPIIKYWDPNNAFLKITIHHIFQGLIFILLMYVVSKVFKFDITEFGFTTNKFCYALKIIFIFSCIWAVVQVFGGLIYIYIAKLPFYLNYKNTLYNFIGYFLFQIIISGTSEELFYRAIVITILLKLAETIPLKNKASTIIAILFSTLLFMFDHINFTLFPFRITHIDLFQQLTVLIFGLLYCFLYIKTKSIIGPIIAHNVLNGIIVSANHILFITYR